MLNISRAILMVMLVTSAILKAEAEGNTCDSLKYLAEYAKQEIIKKVKSESSDSLNGGVGHGTVEQTINNELKKMDGIVEIIGWECKSINKNEALVCFSVIHNKLLKVVLFKVMLNPWLVKDIGEDSLSQKQIGKIKGEIRGMYWLNKTKDQFVKDMFGVEGKN